MAWLVWGNGIQHGILNRMSRNAPYFIVLIPILNTYDYFINPLLIPSKTKQKDFGDLTFSNMKWISHVAVLVEKVKRESYMVLQIFKNISP